MSENRFDPSLGKLRAEFEVISPELDSEQREKYNDLLKSTNRSKSFALKLANLLLVGSLFIAIWEGTSGGGLSSGAWVTSALVCILGIVLSFKSDAAVAFMKSAFAVAWDNALAAGLERLKVTNATNPFTPRVDENCLSRITGTWEGAVGQKIGERDAQMPVKFRFKAEPEGVTGIAEIQSPDLSAVAELQLKGSVRLDKFLLAEYVMGEGQSQSFGSLLLEVGAETKRMEGRFIGYGIISRMVVTGSISIQKTD